jgi:hypothetical protein
MNLNLKKIALISLAVSGALALQPVAALPLIDNGPYFDLGLGYGNVNENVSAGSTDNNALMYGLEAGYFLFHGIGVDAGFYQFPTIVQSGTKKNVISSNFSGQVSVRGSLPMPMLFTTIFCKLGMGLSHNKFGSAATTFTNQSYTKVTGFGAIGIKFSVPVPLTPKLSFEGVAFSGNGKQVPSRLGVLATIGWDFT